MLAKRILLSLLGLALSGCAALAGETPPLISLDPQPSSTPIPAPTPSATPTVPAARLLEVAQDAANQGLWTEAVILLDQALAQDVENPQAWWLRGNAHRQLGEYETALSDYDQAIRLDVNYASAFHSRGQLHSQQGNLMQALDDFAQAIELTPHFGPPYRSRAEAHIALGNLAAAALDLQIYLTFVPNAPDREAVEAQIAGLQEQLVEQARDGLLFFDDFSDPTSGWYTNGDPASPGLYAGEGYVLRVTQSVPGGATGVWAMPGRLFSDTRIQVSAHKQTGTDNNFYGVLCRIQGTNVAASFYAFLISSDGYYVIAKRVNEGELRGIGQDQLLPSGQIRLGTEVNQIEAVCDGPRLALYVNGELVYETQDGDLTSGQVGMIAGTYEDTTSVFFDDFAVFSTEP
ncbi:MAG: tetratricopeptide repeat protein [Anaerolineales bacterium]|nr:tetratricopeptide repeat protein [Anaerolineales bacterium]